MKGKPFPLNSTMVLWPWEHINQEYLTPFGGLVQQPKSRSEHFHTKPMSRHFYFGLLLQGNNNGSLTL